MRIDRQLVPAAQLRPEELGTVLASLGPEGDGRTRLSAVVALLSGTGKTRGEAGGAFADGPAMMTEAFTSAFHNCLREPPINRFQRPSTKPA